ncbi:MAG: exodeoxyribonuclease VII large subunit, partial [Alistipes sp.]|nr:exodeoxyribonuclease VII large subunit [Alistipes sp.]
GHTHAAALQLQRLTGELRRMAGERLAAERVRLTRLAERPAEAVRDLLALQRIRVGSAAEIVAAHSPERLLKLGFALLRSGGRAVTAAAQAQAGDEVEIRLSDGILTATIQKTTIWPKKRSATKKR